jgi:hypothetical protein
MLVFFASSKYDQAEVSSQMKSAFAEAEVLGCSTAGEIISGHMLESSMVAMVLDSEAIEDVSIEVVEQVNGGGDIAAALSGFGQHFGTSMADLDFSSHVGLVLVDGLCGAEERLMDTLGDLTDVPFVGGSAGDDLKFEQTWVHANGSAYSNAAVLAVCKPRCGFDIIKTQSFSKLPQQLVATKVDEARRTVFEFNDRPAIDVYAELLGTPATKASKLFMSNPLGISIGDDIFVRSPQRVAGQAMVFYSNIKQGMELDLLESTDIVVDTRRAVEAKQEQHGSIVGIINFNCILRTLDLERRGQKQDYGEIFASIPTIGFNTYGEEYIGHINQTATMLVFK